MEEVNGNVPTSNLNLKTIDIEKNFNFGPHIFTPLGIVDLQLYTDLGENTVLLLKDGDPMKILT